MPATITGLDFIILPTQDKNRAINFYRDILGLQVDCYWGETGAEFKLGNDTTLAIVDSKAMEKPFAAFTAGAIAFRVSDVEAMVQELQAKGIIFMGDVIDSGVCNNGLFL